MTNPLRAFTHITEHLILNTQFMSTKPPTFITDLQARDKTLPSNSIIQTYNESKGMTQATAMFPLASSKIGFATFTDLSLFL